MCRLARALCPITVEYRGPRPAWPCDHSRYEYQKRLVAFDIPPGAKVLDIGSGGFPFPKATVLADKYASTTLHRADPLALDHRPFVECDVQELPFAAKEFDFVYCCHVLEHVDDPLRACSEIVRVGRRGYIETPLYATDVLFAWAGEMHKWHVCAKGHNLVFFEYSERELKGVRSEYWRDAVLSKRHHPLQDVFYGNLEVFEVMFSWTGGFTCHVFKTDGTYQAEALS